MPDSTENQKNKQIHVFRDTIILSYMDKKFSRPPEITRMQEQKETCILWLTRALRSLEKARDTDPDSIRCTVAEDVWRIAPQLPEGIIFNNFDGAQTPEEYILLLKNLISGLASLEAEASFLNDPYHKKKDGLSASKEFSIIVRPSWLIFDRNGNIPDNNAFLVYGWSDPSVDAFAQGGVLDGTPISAHYALHLRDSESFRYSQENVFQDIIARLASDPPITVDTFLRWPTNQAQLTVRYKIEIFDALIMRYLQEMDHAREYEHFLKMLLEAQGSHLSVDDILRFREALPFLKDLQPFRSLTVAHAYEHFRQLAYTQNRYRANLHRRIEAFGHVFLNALSRLCVINLIEAAGLRKRGGVREIMPGIFGSMRGEATSHSFDRTAPGLRYGVSFGTGETYTRSSDGMYEPAPSPRYESRIRSGRSIYEDRLLVDEIVAQLHDRFPLLQILNNVYQTGSFHEKFADHELAIAEASIAQQAEDRGMSINTLLDYIDSAVKEAVETARSG